MGPLDVALDELQQDAIRRFKAGELVDKAAPVAPRFDLAAMAKTGPDGPDAMTSKDLADFLESRHDNVVRSIERLVKAGEIVHPPMEDEPGTDAVGRPRTTKVYLLDRLTSIAVAAQVSPSFTVALVKRWDELERTVAAAPAPSAPEPELMTAP